MKTNLYGILALLLMVAMITPYFSFADHADSHTIAQLQAQVQTLLAQVTNLQQQIVSAIPSQTAPDVSHNEAPMCVFTRDLHEGTFGVDVQCLQRYLNSTGFVVAFSGSGSPGNETQYFGNRTKNAVSKWQTTHVVTPAAGYFGPRSRAKFSILHAGTPQQAGGNISPQPSSTTGITHPAVWSGLLVEKGAQPTSTLVPQSAARVPFTRFILSASSDQDISIQQIVIERRGLAANTAFASVVLIDDAGIQIGSARTINSNNQAVFNEKITLPKGTSKTITVAANMNSSLSAHAGQVATFALVSINAGGTMVQGDMPFVGAPMTINATLPIGTISASRSQEDPALSVVKSVGTKNYTFSAVRLTAGSSEDVALESITWTQAGSATVGDIVNIKTVVNGASYFTIISENSKRYTAIFPGGIRIAKGSTLDIALRGDILGGSGRTIDFDIERRSDIVARGMAYGYYVLPADGTAISGKNDSNFHKGAIPWFDASQATVGTGTLRVEKTNIFTSGDVSESNTFQTLAAFTFEASGEDISISNIIVDIDVTGTGSADDITLVGIYNSSGELLAGPVDAKSNTSGQDGTISFTDTFEIPAGEHVYYLKGRVGTNFAEGDTIVFSILPPAITATGVITSNSIISSPQVAVKGSSVTVKTGSIMIVTALTPVSQNIVRGASAFTFATLLLDASASGEDIRVSALSLTDTPGNSANTSHLNTCRLYDENNGSLQSSGNIVHPDSSTMAKSFRFRLDVPLVVTKGTTRALFVGCAISSNALDVSTHTWKLNVDSSTHGINGVSSGKTVTPTVIGSGQTMTIKEKGTLMVLLDSSNPSYRIVAADSNDTITTVYKFVARDEPVRVTQIGLQLSDAVVNTPAGIIRATLWDGNTKIGEARFIGSYATSTITNFIVPKDSEKRLTVKTDLAPIGIGKSGIQGLLVKIDYDGDAGDTTGNATRGLGLSSGTTLLASGNDTVSSGMRVFRGYPIVAVVTNGLQTRYGNSSTNVPLYRFAVTANTYDISLYKFTFRISTSTSPNGSNTSVTNLRLYGYADSSMTSPVSPWQGGQLNTTRSSMPGAGLIDIDVYFNGISAPVDQKLTIPAGATRYFEIRGDITLAGNPSGGSIRTHLEGDSAYTSFSSFVGTTSQVDGDTNNNFIWSPNANIDSLTTEADWTNGFRVEGLPSTGLTPWIMTK